MCADGSLWWWATYSTQPMRMKGSKRVGGSCAAKPMSAKSQQDTQTNVTAGGLLASVGYRVTNTTSDNNTRLRGRAVAALRQMTTKGTRGGLWARAPLIAEVCPGAVDNFCAGYHQPHHCTARVHVPCTPQPLVLMWLSGQCAAPSPVGPPPPRALLPHWASSTLVYAGTPLGGGACMSVTS